MYLLLHLKPVNKLEVVRTIQKLCFSVAT